MINRAQYDIVEDVAIIEIAPGYGKICDDLRCAQCNELARESDDGVNEIGKRIEGHWMCESVCSKHGFIFECARAMIYHGLDPGF